jgi:uncharacterized membrane protein YhaH (DUF805 family)
MTKGSRARHSGATVTESTNFAEMRLGRAAYLRAMGIVLGLSIGLDVFVGLAVPLFVPLAFQPLLWMARSFLTLALVFAALVILAGRFRDFGWRGRSALIPASLLGIGAFPGAAQFHPGAPLLTPAVLLVVAVALSLPASVPPLRASGPVEG